MNQREWEDGDMSMSQELTPQTAENLQQRIHDLAGLMSRVAESLHQGDPVELQHLSDEINAVQHIVRTLSRQLEDHPLLADSERHVNRVGEIIESCKKINMRQEAIDQLKRLQLIKSFDQNDHEAFEQLQSRIAAVLHPLTNGSVEQRREAMESIMDRQSAFRALYEMVNRPEELSDDRWLEAQKIITETFGRNVAMAVIRGRAR